MENTLKQKTVEVGGVTYTLQKIPFKFYLEINDRHTNKSGVLMRTPYIAELFKHCVVSPKVTLDTFDDDMSAGMELVGEVESFLVTKSEPTTNQETSNG
ncbi:MAG: hypothetical protein FWC16_00790 [Defluviitaleaceae bacterium]|nr:hypothetical protein [Defluviitaleaceae bacterium]MCL2273441.1 hypothetical protein [Defluviitaleaceae bacterium]